MIYRIEALNYRSLRHVSQELRPFEVLVGPNASGKSTFLDVPAFISDFVSNGLREATLFTEESGMGRARRLGELIFNQDADHLDLALELTIPDNLIRLNGISGATYHYDIARYELAIGRINNGEAGVLGESLWLNDSRYRRGGMSGDNASSATTLPSSNGARPTTLITSSADPTLASYRVILRSGERDASYFAETEKWEITNRVGLQRSVLSGLPEDPERFPIAIWVRDLLLDGILKLALNSAAMRRPVSPSASHAFDVEGANLPLVIQDLQGHNPVGYKDWVAHIQTVLPDVEAIQVYERPEDRFLYLAVKYAGLDGPVPSWLVSDGTLRLMALTLLPYLSDESRVYLIEEPENGIHPKAIEGVYQSLSSAYNGQVLVATHSPLFLALAEPAQLLVFSKDAAGAVHIVRGDKHPALENWRGQTDLSTLYAAGVLG